MPVTLPPNTPQYWLPWPPSCGALKLREEPGQSCDSPVIPGPQAESWV